MFILIMNDLIFERIINILDDIIRNYKYGLK